MKLSIEEIADLKLLKIRLESELAAAYALSVTQRDTERQLDVINKILKSQD
jgi:hypothetical protein